MKSIFFCNSVENAVTIFSLNSVGSRKTGLSFIELSASIEIPFYDTEDTGDAEDTSEDPASKSEKTNYDKVGFTEEKIAIGVDVEDVLK